jgi:tetratricopeptide (TPR) repeat protein
MTKSAPRRFLAELKERPVWQVAGLYLGFSWIVMQVIDVLAQNLDIPPSLFPSALVLLAIGFVVVLITSIVQRGVEASAGTQESAGSQPAGLKRVFTWRNAITAGVVVFAAWGAVSAVLWLREGSGSTEPGISSGTANANSLVVLPFTYQGDEDHRYLGGGIVDLLSTKLDGAGDLRAVDPRAVLSFSAEQGGRALGPSEASAAAANFGAGLFVLGNIVEVGDRLTLNASLYEAAAGLTPVVEASATGDAEAVFESVDELAAQLLAGIGTGPAARVQQLAAGNTASLQALRAYLEGEQAYRRGQYREAVESFQRAVEIDSEYALAYYRLSMVAEFSTMGELAQETAELAVRHADRLSKRDRDLLEALLAWRRGAHAEAEELYRGLVRAYPDEVEAWFELGEVLMHGNPLHGRSFAEAWDAFSRVLELDPQNTAAMYHLARIASITGRYDALDSLTALHNRLNPGGDRELEITALQAFSRPNPAAQSEILSRLRSGPDVGVALSGWDVSTWTEDVDGGRDVVTVLTDPTRPIRVQALGHAWLAQIELAAGRIEAAGERLDRVAAIDSVSHLEYRALLSANPLFPASVKDLQTLANRLEALDARQVPPSDNPSIFYSVHDDVHPLLRSYLLGVTYGMLGDSVRAFEFAAETEQMPVGVAEGSMARDLAASIRAQWHWRQGRHEQALTELEPISRELWYIGTLVSPFYGQALERYLLGELLYQVGRAEEAIPWFANSSQIAPYELAFRPLAYERLGQIYESLGQPEAAVEYYRKLVAMWRDADPELQPRLAAAEAAIARLTG